MILAPSARFGPSQEDGGGEVQKLGSGHGAAQAPGRVQGPRPAWGSGGQSPLEAEKI